ncbi:MAG: HD domain-containing protein [Bacilli bacterium]|jgi:HD-GYP domain-containing protein (c-di-GMP phosphodiesterase class II)|nr:HD domain-containing protein [Bacilli bacterium]
MAFTKEEIEKFYQDYTAGVKQIPTIENELHAPQKNQTVWIDFLKEKANLFRSLFVTSEEQLDKFVYPFIKSPSLLNEEEVEAFLKGNADLAFKGQVIDFLLDDDLTKVLLDYQYQHQMPLDGIFLTLRLLQIALSRYLDAEKTKEAAFYSDKLAAYYPLFKDGLDKYAKKDEMRSFIIASIFNAFYFEAEYQHQANKHDYVELNKSFELLLTRYEGLKPYLSEKEKPSVDIRIEVAYETIIDVFMAFEKHMLWDKTFIPLSKEEEKIEDALAKRVCAYLTPVIEANGKEKMLNEYSHLLYCRFKTGLIDISEYTSSLEEMYSWRNNEDSKKDLYSSDQFFYKVVVSVDLSYAIFSNPDIKKEQGQKEILAAFRETLSYLKSIPQAFYNSSLMKVTTDYLIDIMPIIPDDGNLAEDIASLFFFQQTSTLIHTRMVEAISLCLGRKMIEIHSEDFLDDKYKDKGTVVKSKKDILAFISKASLLHDIGKAPFWDIINLQRRKITAGEFSAIKMHSAIGYEILSSNKSLAKYADVARLHHKWYDGTKGYPEEADNLSSQYKIYVDIVSVADTIDAGTDYLGRSYSAGKTFKTILEELNAQAGTRYNPKIVKMINEDTDLQDSLTFLTTEGRKMIYGSVYQDYLADLNNKH